MKIRMWMAAAAAGVMMMATAQAAAQTTVTGTVSNPAGRVVEHATVTLQTGTTPALTRHTGTDGRFSFEDVPAGRYTIVATAVGLSPATQHLQVGDAAAPITLDLTLADIVRERVHVIGDQAARERTGGSSHRLDGTTFDRLKLGTDDIHQMLRVVPGLNIQEEDGYGLRPNIGMRGTGTDRSSRITMLEDGVLIAPAPYSAPAAYYAPTPGRMEAIEVRKGSSQIKSGPITTGGVLNYVSSSIPTALQLRASVAGGGDRTRRISAGLGDSGRHVGWLVETHQFSTDGFKRLDGGGDTGVVVADYMAKLRLNTTPSAAWYHEVEFKVGHTTQHGDETYLGLTDADFRLTPYRRYAASQVDRFDSDHTQVQVRYLVARPAWDLTTVAYHNDFSRAWYKLENVAGTSLSSILANPSAFAPQMAVLTGGPSAVDALTVRNNNRGYFGRGVQSTFGLRHTTGAVRHQFEIGLRYHEDEEDRFQQDDRFQMVNRRMVLTSAGAPGSQTNQVVGAAATAVFLTDTMRWGAWTFTPGLRYESIDFTRTDYARNDPARTAPAAVIPTSVNVVIPGAGLTYNAGTALTLFGGIHKGFAPPGPGAAAGTKAEQSVNYEAGARWAGTRGFAEVTTFFSDYSNLLGRDTLSTGGTGSGDLYNGGRAHVRGLEASGRWAPLQVTYTYTRATFGNSFVSTYGPWATVTSGDALPYVPTHQLYAALDAEAGAWRARVDLTTAGRMRTVAGTGALPASRATDTTFVIGGSAEYRLTTGARLFASIQNAANRAAIVSRHPAGVRPGLSRLVMVGLSVEVGR